MGSRSSRSSIDSHRARTSTVWASASAPYRSSTNLRARSRYSSCSWTPVSRRPSCSVTVCWRVGSWEMARSPATGPSMLRSTETNFSSIIASTSAVVPTLRYVETSERLASPMITCSRRYFSGSACGSSRVLMIGRLSVVSSPTSTSKKSARWLSWKPVLAAVLAPADAPGAGDDLAADEERRQVAHDVAERRRAAHQVVLVGAVGGALVVGVVLVQHDRRGTRDRTGALGGIEHDLLARLVPAHDVEGGGHLGRGVLRVRVVDVEPGPVGEDDVGQAHVLVGELRGIGDAARHVETPGVAQRRLLLEVPARAARLDRGRGVGVDHLRRRHHRVGHGLTDHRDAVLDLGAHHPADAHVTEPTGS